MGVHGVAVALLMTAALTAAACSGDVDRPAGNEPPTATEKLGAAGQLAVAKARADAATSMHLTVRSSGVPDSVNGVLGVDGSGTHAPAFKGTLEVRISGFQVKVEAVALGEALYVKLPFTTAFTQVDPKEFSAPNPAKLFATKGGIASLMTATTNPGQGKPIREGAEVLNTVTGKLSGDRVAPVLGIGDATQTFDVTYGITEPGGELRKVTVIGPFYRGAISTYTLTLDKYGAPVEITKPSVAP